MEELVGLWKMFVQSMQSPVSVTVVIIIAGICVYYYVECHKKIKYIRKIIDDINKKLNNFDNNNASINYENINAVFTEAAIGQYIWLEYKKTLVNMEKNGMVMVYSTKDADSYFNITNVAADVNLSFWNNLGGIFTGLGILGTFAGLSVGLSTLDLQNISNKEIAALVSGMNTAFFTSLLGIFAALIFNFKHKNLVESLAKSIKGLSEKLEELFNPQSTEQLLAMSYTQVEEQTKQFKSFSDNLAISIGDALENKLSNSNFADNIRNMDNTMNNMSNFMTQELSGIISNAISTQIKEHMAPIFLDLRETIDKLSTSGQSAIADGIKNGASKELTSFAEALQKMNDNLQISMEQMQKTSGSVNDDLTTAINRVVDRLENQGANLQSIGSQVTEDLKNSVQALVIEIGKQQSGMINTSDKINTELKDSLSTMLIGIQSSIEAMVEATQKQQDNMHSSANNISNDLSNKMAEMLAGFEKQIEAIDQQTRNQSQALNDTSNKVVAQLGSSVDDIFGNMSNKMAEMLVGFEKQIEAIDQQTRNQSQALSDTSNLVVNSFGHSMDALKTDIKTIMEEYIAKNKIENEETIQYIKQLKNGLIEQQSMLGKITVQVDALITKAANTAEKFGQAAGPINNAGLLLGEKIDTIVNATNDYNKTVKENVNYLYNSAQLNVDNMKMIGEEIQNIKECLVQASSQYSGVNNELNNILETLNRNLSSYNKSINEQYVNSLSVYSEKLSDAYGQLITLVEELSDTVDNIKQ